MKLLEKRVETSAPGKGSAYVKALLAPMFKGNKLEYISLFSELRRLVTEYLISNQTKAGNQAPSLREGWGGSVF